MANTRTLLQLRTSVRIRGGYEGSLDITDALLNEFINEGIAETREIVIEKWADYYTTWDVPITYTNPFPLAAGANPNYSLPDDFFKLRKVEILLSGDPTLPSARWGRLLPHNLDGSHRFRSGERYRYRVQNGLLWFAPPPTTTDWIRIWYIPIATRLSSDGDTFDGIDNFEELVIQLALLRCRSREELPTDEIEREIARLIKRVHIAADNVDAAEPFYLNGRGPGPSDVDDEDW